ncbi:MAG TPA: ATP-binding protein [Bradyrhizobium sp.]|nr:ATP-binding protein [Bradyrhizobium sp.]
MTDLVEKPARADVRQILARSPILRYGFSVVSVAVALGFALVVSHDEFRYLGLPVLALAVALAAWYAGTGPSVLAVVLASASYDFFFTEPLYQLTPSISELPHIIIFVIWAAVAASFSAVRRRAEDGLLQALDRLKIEVDQRTQQARLLDQTHDAIFVRQTNSLITFWNRGAQELYGLSAEQAVGKYAHELLRTVFPTSYDQIVEELHRTGRWEGELKHTKADGTDVVVASRWSLQRDDKEQPIAILETCNDITERKRREDEVRRLNQELANRAAELEASNKELESFAYSVSHDLRAPLRHVAGYAELLRKQASSALDEKSLRYMTMILEASKKMGTLIDDLLAFSRIGRAETRKTAVDLGHLVGEVVAELGQETKGRDIAWTVGAIPTCHGDRAMLKLVLANLLSNAVKFTHERSRAEIEIGCADDNKNEVTVFVRDNGAGFDMRYVGKLFGVFQRLHSAEEFEGTGIGLATVQRIIFRHGGQVRAEGAIDQGATFYFSLPKA